MKSLRVALIAGVAVLLAISGPQGVAQADGKKKLRADLRGFEEPPAVSSTGSGEFRARISDDGTELEYTLQFEDLEGDVTQSHIHLGQKGVNGGITIWLCGTTPDFPGPANTPSCGGPRSGGASRTVSAADVIGPAGQGVAPGEFAEVLTAIREGVTYANVHSRRNLLGEIRGQIRGRDKDDDHDD